jgi:hypothetical protein
LEAKSQRFLAAPKPPGKTTASKSEALSEARGDVGEPEVAALVAVGQPLVVDAEQVQHGGVRSWT